MSEFKIFPCSRSDGMNTYDLSPALAALAATELARLPVEAQATVSKPSSLERLRATLTTRSLKERGGELTASFLTYNSRMPSFFARRSALMRGVKPTCLPTVGSPAIG